MAFAFIDVTCRRCGDTCNIMESNTDLMMCTKCASVCRRGKENHCEDVVFIVVQLISALAVALLFFK